MGAKKQQSKMIAGNARSLYDSKLLSLADQVDCIPKKVLLLDKNSRALLKQRDVKFIKTGDAFNAYAKEMTAGANATYMANCGKVMHNIAAKYKDTDAKLMVEFSNKLAAWIAEHQNLMDIQLKHMEDMRKEFQKCERGIKKNPDQFIPATNAAKEAWQKVCADTVIQMEKFLTEAGEITRLTSMWIQLEGDLDSCNAIQCKSQVTGRVPNMAILPAWDAKAAAARAAAAPRGGAASPAPAATPVAATPPPAPGAKSTMSVATKTESKDKTQEQGDDGAPPQ